MLDNSGCTAKLCIIVEMEMQAPFKNRTFNQLVFFGFFSFEMTVIFTTNWNYCNIYHILQTYDHQNSKLFQFDIFSILRYLGHTTLTYIDLFYKWLYIYTFNTATENVVFIMPLQSNITLPFMWSLYSQYIKPLLVVYFILSK